jgi:hypothetical protein
MDLADRDLINGLIQTSRKTAARPACKLPAMAIGPAPRSTATPVEPSLDAQEPSSPTSNCELAVSPVIQERRSRQRFSIVQPMRYAVSNSKECTWSGEGTVLNISSAGVCFTTEASLSPGPLVKLAVSWPALLHGSVSIELVINCIVVRATTNTAAAKIEYYGFYTQSVQPPKEQVR